MKKRKTKRKILFWLASVIFAALIVGFAWLFAARFPLPKAAINTGNVVGQREDNNTQTIELSITWRNLDAQMVALGVIDSAKLEALYSKQGGLTNYKKQLPEGDGGKMAVTSENSGLVLNLLWGLGLSNKNKILEKGPMTDSKYGGANQFASTGGWTISNGNVMDHYSMHSLITLTDKQQDLVERIAKNIYRPCCDNSTYFPDCNHGMAMLGLLELLASQNISENQMYQIAFQMNQLWFPDQYAVIARYLATKNQTFAIADPKEILGSEYSSSAGFQRISALVPQEKSGKGSGCGLIQ